MPAESRYHHGDLRAALLDAAGRILAADGLEGLSLRSVARAAGVSHAAPYHHFADKTHLLAAVAVVGFENLVAAMRAGLSALPPSADPLDRVSAVGIAYIRHAVTHPEVFRIMFRPELTGTDHEELDAAGKAAFGTLLEQIVAAQEAGRIAPGDPTEIGIGCWSAVHGASVLWLDGPLQNADKFGPRDPDQIAQLVTGQVRRALEGPKPGDA